MSIKKTKEITNKKQLLKETRYKLQLKRRELGKIPEEIASFESLIAECREQIVDLENKSRVTSTDIFYLSDKADTLQREIQVLETGELTTEQRAEAKNKAARGLVPLMVYLEG